MSSPIRFGFIGTGAISDWSAASVKAHPMGRLVAAHDPHPGRLEAFCKTHALRGYSTAKELLHNPDIDAVYIAVPNKFHVPLALEALAAGKHVLLEKPFALNAAEAKKAADAAQAAGKVLTVGMNQRFSPNAQKFRTLVATGALGEVYHAKACWLRRTGIPKLGTWFGSRDLAGGGCLYDIGVHMLDLCLYIMGNFEPVSVFGATYTKFGNRGLGGGSWGHSENAGLPFEVEDFASAQVRFANGASLVLDVSWARHAADNDRLEIDLFGTEAGASVIAGKLYRQGTDGYTILDNPAAPAGTLERPDRFHNFINHLLGKEELVVSLEQALVVQRILDAIAESARSAHSVSIQP